MLRLANASDTYEVSIEVAGKPVKFQLRPITLPIRAEIVHKVSQFQFSADGYKDLFTTLDKVIVEIEGHEGAKVVDVLAALEHHTDLDAITNGIITWCTLDEQSAKNFASSLERSRQASVRNAEKHADPEDAPASTIPDRMEQSEPADKE